MNMKSAPSRTARKATVTPANIQYFDASRNWCKIARHESNVILQNILVKDFNKYTYGRWNKRFSHGQFPAQFESCDWQLHRVGRTPNFWKYVKHGACHWLVNFNLMLATLVEPKRAWRILASDDHSTVWDGHETLFDLNFLALQVPAEECFSLANDKQLQPGQFNTVYYAPHYTVEMAEGAREKQELVERYQLLHPLAASPAPQGGEELA